jgi:hypothetical protein
MLTRLILMAAQTAADVHSQLPPQQPSKLFGLSVRDIVLLLGLVAVIALSLYLFAYLTRRKRHRRISRSGPEMWGADRHAQQSERREKRVRIRKKRAKHPDFRPRNPTLGETGGLPPVRPDEPAQPAT